MNKIKILVLMVLGFGTGALVSTLHPILSISLTSVFMFVILPEIVSVLVIGKYVGDNKYEYVLNSLNGATFCGDDGFISFKGPGYIARVPWSLICTYYIKDVGVVPRWTKTHKLIDEYFKAYE